MQENIAMQPTKKQKEMLFLLFQFRFIHTNQFQKLLSHKNPKRIQIWLKKLKDNGYIKTKYNPKSFVDKTKPAIYYLSSKAIAVLKRDKAIDKRAMQKIYTEKKRKQKFINHCIDITDIYLFLCSRKKKGEVLSFFTQNELLPYDYFPNPLPSGYITVENTDTIQHYFLDIFDMYTPKTDLRNRINLYFKYFESGNWEEHAQGADFPTILFICSTIALKKSIILFTQELFVNAYGEKLDLFVTTKENIVKTEGAWEQVVME